MLPMGAGMHALIPRYKFAAFLVSNVNYYLTTDGCRVQVHDCMVELASSVCRRNPASWSLSSLFLDSELPEVPGSENNSCMQLHNVSKPWVMRAALSATDAAKPKQT